MTKAAPDFLPYARQLIDDDDIEAVTRVLRGDWLTRGPASASFELALAREVDARRAVVVSSGTAALHLAYLALGIGPGDRVVVPTVTFLASASAVRYAGGEVIFADVDSDTGLMRESHFREALSRAGDGAQAVCMVHLNGQCADVAAISAIAREHGMAVVEDACHALGADYREAGDRCRIGACAHADLTVFSFHPAKTIAMGEGGALTTNDDVLAGRLCDLRNHGMVAEPERFEIGALALDSDGVANPWYYELHELGFNYRASDIHCALGISQLRKLRTFVERRRDLAARYDERLSALDGLVRPLGRVESCLPAWHLYVAHIDFAAAGAPRAAVMRALRRRGIGTQVHYLPVHRQPYYSARYGALALAGADAYYERVLSLPLHAGMTSRDVDTVVDALSDALVTRAVRAAG